jgi:hypothetical protein
MYNEVNDQPAKANSSNINEDLGQVEYLFSDKTGKNCRLLKVKIKTYLFLQEIL